ncbi:MAG: hypothetical protein KatS3mg082_0787 [Nitrospiraceae bacterium]|nr:MAG: hypothetical protein KatS3mg082_0787 [Nitrospiraceae bacterium]
MRRSMLVGMTVFLELMAHGLVPLLGSGGLLSSRSMGRARSTRRLKRSLRNFRKPNAGRCTFTVGISGTGGGFKKFCRGETDISDASRPILKEEMDLCQKNGVKYFELPIAFDALTVAVSPKNTWVSAMTVAELKKIWEPAAQGKITRWNHVRPDWPDAPARLVRSRLRFRHLRLFHGGHCGKSQGQSRRLHGQRG